MSNRQLLDDVRRIHAGHHKRYGSPRVHAALRAEGVLSLLAAGLGAASADVTPVQYREVRKFSRINRRGQFCRVKVVRRYTPRGVVVRRVRNCI